MLIVNQIIKHVIDLVYIVTHNYIYLMVLKWLVIMNIMIVV